MNEFGIEWVIEGTITTIESSEVKVFGRYDSPEEAKKDFYDLFEVVKGEYRQSIRREDFQSEDDYQLALNRIIAETKKDSDGVLSAFVKDGSGKEHFFYIVRDDSHANLMRLRAGDMIRSWGIRW